MSNANIKEAKIDFVIPTTNSGNPYFYGLKREDSIFLGFYNGPADQYNSTDLSKIVDKHTDISEDLFLMRKASDVEIKPKVIKNNCCVVATVNGRGFIDFVETHQFERVDDLLRLAINFAYGDPEKGYPINDEKNKNRADKHAHRPPNKVKQRQPDNIRAVNIELRREILKAYKRQPKYFVDVEVQEPKDEVETAKKPESNRKRKQRLRREQRQTGEANNAVEVVAEISNGSDLKILEKPIVIENVDPLKEPIIFDVTEEQLAGKDPEKNIAQEIVPSTPVKKEEAPVTIVHPRRIPIAPEHVHNGSSVKKTFVDRPNKTTSTATKHEKISSDTKSTTTAIAPIKPHVNEIKVAAEPKKDEAKSNTINCLRDDVSREVCDAFFHMVQAGVNAMPKKKFFEMIKPEFGDTVEYYVAHEMFNDPHCKISMVGYQSRITRFLKKFGD